jgi:multidrug efflux pump subunit AcrA (membrane-fusion protein)
MSRNQTKTLPQEIIETVTFRNVQNILSLEGNIAPIDERDLVLPSGAKVTDVKVKEGDTVKKDALLAKYETSTLTGTKKNDFKASIAGKIAKLNIKTNELFTGTEPAVILVDDSSLQINADVNENDISQLSTGLATTVVVPAVSLLNKYNSTINTIAITPTTQNGSVNYRVVFKPDQLPGNAKIGMSADLEVKVAEVDHVLAVPDSYIISKGTKYFVKVLTYKNPEKTDYNLTETEVTLGLRTDQLDEVKSGLKDADLIVPPSFVPQGIFGLFGSSSQ